MREDTLKRLPRQHVRGIQPHDRTYVAQTLQNTHEPLEVFFLDSKLIAAKLSDLSRSKVSHSSSQSTWDGLTPG